MKKFFVMMTAVLCLLCSAIAFTSCGNTPDGPGSGGSGNEQGGGSQSGSHVHSLQKHEEKEPTCTEDGNILYYECENCHDLFLDDAGKEPTTKTAVTQNSTGHKAEEEWVKDGTSHWHNCKVCGQKVPESVVAHSYDAEWQKDAASHWKECNVCGYLTKSAHEFGENGLCGVCNEKRKDPSKGLEYRVNTKDGGNSYLVAGIGSCKDTDIVIPETHDGKPVTAIGRAFYEYRGLTSIIIPNSVTSIEEYAFYHCYGLTSIVIPDSVTSIGDRAFDGCERLTSVTIGRGMTSIGTGVFSGCSELTSIIIPDSVTSIGTQAFRECSRLTSIDIPGSVTSIGLYAFYGCSGLISIVIPDSVTSIEDQAFYNCSGLQSVTIGNGVTSIGNSAFSGCSKLTSITIPDNVTSIGSSAFAGCSNLKEVHFENPDGWRVSKRENTSNGNPVVGLNDPATAAKYLTSLDSFCTYYWIRKR